MNLSPLRTTYFLTALALTGTALAQNEPVAIPRPPATDSAIPSLSEVTDKLPENVQEVLTDTRVKSIVDMAQDNQDEILRGLQNNYDKVKDSDTAVTEIANTTQPVAQPVQPGPAQPVTTPPTPTVGSSNAPEPLKPRYQRTEADAPNTGGNRAVGTKTDGEVMKILANQSEMRQEEALIIFKGDVFVVEPTFTLFADELWVYQYADGETPAVNAKGEEQSIKRAIASGSIVEIKRIDAAGKAQVAQARRADYDGATGKMVLTGGPPVIQSDGKLVQTRSADAQIILTPDGRQQVIDRKGGEFIIPIKKKGDENSTLSIPSGSGGLDSIRSSR